MTCNFSLLCDLFVEGIRCSRAEQDMGSNGPEGIPYHAYPESGCDEQSASFGRRKKEFGTEPPAAIRHHSVASTEVDLTRRSVLSITRLFLRVRLLTARQALSSVQIWECMDSRSPSRSFPHK